ncbi:MAG: hypothetical protein EPN70_14945 [Paraburkholderia sp.]|uniref:hypothetical protein n=1 Tax=Paraburkholderia sp. TaxID=1926495 RepID=UPI00122A857A|nr:hypothetical protein [Paraburkholderia sp.]TAM03192.1 MAG: hypothetical protein EPN70_14945 [Paraburkholderia sp.]
MRGMGRIRKRGLPGRVRRDGVGSMSVLCRRMRCAGVRPGVPCRHRWLDMSRQSMRFNRRVMARLAAMTVIPVRDSLRTAVPRMCRARGMRLPALLPGVQRNVARLRRIPYLFDLTGSNRCRRYPHCRNQHCYRPHAAPPEHSSRLLLNDCSIPGGDYTQP